MLQALRDALLPLLHPRRFKRLRVGGRALLLDLRNRHEREYASNPVNIDVLIGRSFIEPGDVVLDAGANIGFTALHYLACGAQTVYACEPERRLYRRLSCLAEARLRTRNVALADRKGRARMYLSQTHNQGHTLSEDIVSLFPDVFGRSVQTEQVRLARIDDLFGEVSFDFMKIDVEGAEVRLLDGAQETLRLRPPRLVQIEAYGATFSQCDERLCEVYAHRRRAGVDNKQRELVLLDPLDEVTISSEAVNCEPPIYLYSQHPLESER